MASVPETQPPPPLLQHTQDGIVTLTLNRPAQYNALSEELLAALAGALDRIAEDEEARVVILAGHGPAFCAGHDLRQMQEHPDERYYRDLFERCSHMMQRLLTMPQPVIARVHGIATAAGCQLVASCDLALASESARFATSGINLGLFCSTPAVALSRRVPPKRAFEMLFTGDFIDAQSAADIGLVNQVVPADALEEATASLAGGLRAKSPVALRIGKRMFYRQLTLPLPEAYAYAVEEMTRNLMSEDAAEGIAAFLAKREPRWRGR